MPDPINYQALMNMMMSKDPRERDIAQQAAKNLQPDEVQQFFDFQKNRHSELGQDGSNRKDSNLLSVGQMGVPPEVVLAGVGSVPKMIQGGLSAVKGEALPLAKGGAMMYGASKLGSLLGMPKELVDMAAMMLGMKGAGSFGAGAAGEVAAGEKAAASVVAPMSDAEYMAANGRPRLGTVPENPLGRQFGPEGPPPAPNNLTQRTSTQAVSVGEGPSGGSRGVSLRRPGAPVDGTGPSDRPMPLNVQRSRSVKDSAAWMEATGGNASQAAHEAGGAMRKGVQVEGDNVLDAYKDAKVLKKVKQRSTKRD